MIHEIAPHCFDNQYIKSSPNSESIALYFEENLSLVKKTSQGIEFPKFKELEPFSEDIYQDAIYLFAIDKQTYFLVTDLDVEKSSEYTMEKVEDFRKGPSLKESFTGLTAYQLFRWYENNQFCGKCATILEHDEKERMLRCNKCKQMIYPRLNPAVIVGVTHKDKILLSRYNGQAEGTYALVAGYVEVGEPLEDAVKREVLEEVGLHVTNIRYYTSQPWPFTDSLLIGFYCDVVDFNEDIVLDKEELSLAQWFEREDIPVKPNNISLTNEMIVQFKNGEV